MMTYRKGFTLIEVLVVIGIMGILMGAGVASYSTMNDKVKVETAVDQLTAQLRVWQKQVDSGVGGGECVGGKFGGLLIHWVSEKVISAKVVCSSGGTTTMTDYTMQNMAVIPQFSDFTFKPLSGGVESSDGNPIMLQVTNLSKKYTYHITISGAGGISVNRAE